MTEVAEWKEGDKSSLDAPGMIQYCPFQQATIRYEYRNIDQSPQEISTALLCALEHRFNCNLFKSDSQDV